MSNYQASTSETYNNAVAMVEMTYDRIDWLYEEEGGINWDVQDLADGSEWYLEDLDADYNYLLKILGDTVGMIQLESKISKLKNDLENQFTIPTN